MDLVVDCYRVTQLFPQTETYGMMVQIRRAVVSVPANIAEGQSRQHRKEFIHHLSIAYGSLAELETHLEIAYRLDYISRGTLDELLAKTSTIAKMLNGLRKSLSVSDN